MKLDNIIMSELKVIASENLDVQHDLNLPDPPQTLAQIIHEEEEKENNKKS
jgi:hypothetical protein